MCSQMENLSKKLPDQLVEVALVDARTAAAVGGMRKSWWYAEIAAGRAPSPVIKQPRCARWRLQEVREFWASRAAASGNDGKAEQVTAQAKRASAAARAKRAAAQGGV